MGIDSGSAPHARGTRDQLVERVAHRRFSPACAGNTFTSGRKTGTPAVQPRMRGEHAGVSPAARAFAGSAPHARGTPASGCPRPSQHRFSPACAGNTKRRSSSAWRKAVQPRMRGEHARSSIHTASPYGSAPHARGTHPLADAQPHATRFSPACAGNTFRHVQTSFKVAVQPRMRGEHIFSFEVNSGGAGSAPHARGTRGD